MIKQLSIKTKIGWISALENDGKIYSIKFPILFMIFSSEFYLPMKHIYKFFHVVFLLFNRIIIAVNTFIFTEWNMNINASSFHLGSLIF